MGVLLDELMSLPCQHHLNSVLVIQPRLVGNGLAYLPLQLLPPHPQLLYISPLQHHSEFFPYLLYQLLVECLEGVSGGSLEADDEVGVGEGEVEGEEFVLLESVLPTDVVHQTALIHIVAILVLFLVLLEPLESEEH